MKKLHYLEKVDSTNDYVVELIKEKKIEDFDAFYTFNQSHGKGQKGNVWFADVDKNISYSLFFTPKKVEASGQFIISQIVSLCVVDFFSKYVSNVTIKWPNDIYWKDKKICGILIETRLMGKSISGCTVGIGLNINQDAFPRDLPNPVSLRMITSNLYSLKALCGDLQNLLVNELSSLGKLCFNDVRKRYFDLLYRKNEFHFYQDKTGLFKAKIINVEPTGLLVLEKESGSTEKYYFKEVKFVL